MTHSETHTNINKAEEAIEKGNYNEAERLANEVINSLPELVEGSEKEMLRANVLCTLGDVARLRGNYPAALDHYSAAQAASEAGNDRKELAKSINGLGIVYGNLSDYAKALEYLQKALAIYEELGSNDGIGRIFGNIGWVYQNLSDYAKTLEYYQKALAIYEELDNKDGIARNLTNIGMVYNFLSDYAKALEYLQKALAIYEELGSKDGFARNLSCIGMVYDNLSDNAKALEYYQKSLVIYEELGRKEGIASNLGNIGLVYGNLTDYAKALEYYQLALAIYGELGTKYGIATNLGNIGLAYLSLSDFAKALEYYQSALAINEELGSKYSIASNLGNIGLLYRNLSDYAKALEYFQKALSINEELGSKFGIAFNLGNIGATYAKPKFEGYDPVKAEEILLKAIALCTEIGEKQHLYVFHKSLADLYKTEKQWKKCQFHFEKYHEIYLEVQSKEAKKQAELMEYRRKIEDAERDRQVKLARFQEQEKILHKTLPPAIANRLISGEKDIADRFESVSILFADIVGFTPLSARKTPREVVHILNNIFSRFDNLTQKFGVERIKTIGDAYMIVAGAPEVVEDHAWRLAQTAFGMLEEIAAFNAEWGESITLRIGLNSGEAIAAVVGDVKFTYDLWSDAVNTASRMESHGEAGKIHVTQDFVNALRTNNDLHIHFTERGEMDIKGKGKMKTYFLEL
jgi:class 3 adenylate cyclase/Tfp pilus assembly protein PilF